MTAGEVELPRHTPSCFGCGPQNQASLGLRVRRLNDQLCSEVQFDERYAGGPGLTHGGAIAAACDEVLGYIVWLIGAPAVTRALSVDFLAPVPLHVIHTISAGVDRQEGRKVFVFAEGRAADGQVRFAAHAVFVRVRLEHFEAYGDITADSVRQAGMLTDADIDVSKAPVAQSDKDNPAPY